MGELRLNQKKKYEGCFSPFILFLVEKSDTELSAGEDWTRDPLYTILASIKADVFRISHFLVASLWSTASAVTIPSLS